MVTNSATPAVVTKYASGVTTINAIVDNIWVFNPYYAWGSWLNLLTYTKTVGTVATITPP